MLGTFEKCDHSVLLVANRFDDQLLRVLPVLVQHFEGLSKIVEEPGVRAVNIQTEEGDGQFVALGVDQDLLSLGQLGGYHHVILFELLHRLLYLEIHHLHLYVEVQLLDFVETCMGSWLPDIRWRQEEVP